MARSTEELIAIFRSVITVGLADKLDREAIEIVNDQVGAIEPDEMRVLAATGIHTTIRLVEALARFLDEAPAQVWADMIVSAEQDQ